MLHTHKYWYIHTQHHTHTDLHTHTPHTQWLTHACTHTQSNSHTQTYTDIHSDSHTQTQWFKTVIHTQTHTHTQWFTDTDTDTDTHTDTHKHNDSLSFEPESRALLVEKLVARSLRYSCLVRCAIVRNFSDLWAAFSALMTERKAGGKKRVHIYKENLYSGLPQILQAKMQGTQLNAYIHKCLTQYHCININFKILNGEMFKKKTGID